MKQTKQIIADDHALIATTFLDILKERFRPKGIIHVGAHMGQEVSSYLDHGYENVFLIEANPNLISPLKQRFVANTKIKIFEGAISDQDEQTELMIHTSRSGSVEAASLLSLKDFKKIVPTLHTPQTVSVSSYRLDSLVERKLLDPTLYNFLILDIQGAELLALKGAKEILKTMDAVQVEVGVIEMYEKQALEDEITSHLTSLGFEKIHSVYHELYDATSRFPAWGEILFSKTLKQSAK